MKKNFLSLALFASILASYAQAGVNTQDPKATFHIVPTAKDNSTAEGIIAPVLTRAELIAKTNNNKYTVYQKGAIVYVEDVSGTISGKTSLVVKAGYYYFDGSDWRPFAEDAAGPGTPYSFKNGITDSAGDIKLGGVLTEGTTITTSTTNSSNFTIAGTGTKTISGGATSISSPLTMSGSTITIKPDNVNPTNGHVLTTNASGVATWAAPAGITSITGSNGITASGSTVQLGSTATNTNAITGTRYVTTTGSLIFDGTGTKTISGGKTTISSALAINTGTPGANKILNSTDASGTTAWSTVSNGLTSSGNTLKLGGSLTGSTDVTFGNSAYVLNFSGTGTSRFKVNTTYFEIQNGNPGSGKILTSTDGYGTTAWQTPAELGLSGSGTVTTANEGLTLSGTTTTQLGHGTRGSSTMGRRYINAGPTGGLEIYGTGATTAAIHTNSLRVAGTGQSYGTGKVLTSDASGNATWQNLPTGSEIMEPTDANAVVIARRSSTNLTITNVSTLTPVPYTVVDTGTSYFNQSTSTFTAPESGIYFFKAYVGLTYSGGTFDGTGSPLVVGFTTPTAPSAMFSGSNRVFYRGAKVQSFVGNFADAVFANLTLPLAKGQRVTVVYAIPSVSSIGSSVALNQNTWLLIYKLTK